MSDGANDYVDKQTALGRDIRIEARALVLRAVRVGDSRYVSIPRAEFEALKRALDAEAAWYERNEA